MCVYLCVQVCKGVCIPVCTGEMGCGLPRLKRSEESPGKIYSTLRRPQVETKVGVAYTYRFLDFLLGNAGESPWQPAPGKSLTSLKPQGEGEKVRLIRWVLKPCPYQSVWRNMISY